MIIRHLMRSDEPLKFELSSLSVESAVIGVVIFESSSRLTGCEYPICNCRLKHCEPLSRNLSPAMGLTIPPSNGVLKWFYINSMSAVWNCILNEQPRPVTSCLRKKVRIRSIEFRESAMTRLLTLCIPPSKANEHNS